MADTALAAGDAEAASMLPLAPMVLVDDELPVAEEALSADDIEPVEPEVPAAVPDADPRSRDSLRSRDRDSSR